MRFSACLVAAAVLATAACDDSEPVGPRDVDAGTLTVDASAGWAFARFEGGVAEEVTVADATTSTDWDIAFNATRVMLNGGAAGPGGVLGFCVCQNEGASNAQVMTMTPASEESDFELVTLADVPAQDIAWIPDALTPAVDEWYSYNPTTHVVSAAPQNVFAVRTAAGAGFAKLRVIDISDATQAHAGDVSIEFAYQPAAGEALGAVDTVVLNAEAGERVLLATGAVGTTGDWDLQVDGWDIRLNGGVSGSGQAGAYLTGMSFDEVVDPGSADSRAFAIDAFAGVFDESPWYRYNIDGNHQIWPTYEVYLIDTADGLYKVQLTGYYSTTGDARHISFRYELLD